uniref:Uncharacterized protein n=1 Tax=Oryza barthii TaxID=65489 RepID=A0A0D3GYH2_9ORYZ
MPPSQSHTPPTLNEALPPQPSIFVAASASKDPGAWRRGTRATTTFFPSSATVRSLPLASVIFFFYGNVCMENLITFTTAILVRSKLNYLMAIYLSTEKNKLLGSPYACVAVQMQPAMECHNELR